jgi:hypothetical protein
MSTSFDTPGPASFTDIEDAGWTLAVPQPEGNNHGKWFTDGKSNVWAIEFEHEGVKHLSLEVYSQIKNDGWWTLKEHLGAISEHEEGYFDFPWNQWDEDEVDKILSSDKREDFHSDLGVGPSDPLEPLD